MRELTAAQKEWLQNHPEFRFVGPPSPRQWEETGNLYADGRYEKNESMRPIRLAEYPVLVGIPK